MQLEKERCLESKRLEAQMSEEGKGGGRRHVPMKDFYTGDDVMTLLHISRKKFYELANRDEDPLPLRSLPGTLRGSVVERMEFKAWVLRNSVPWNKRR